MRATRRAETLGALLIGAVALTLGSAAQANDAPEADALRSRQTRVILSALEPQSSKRRWIPANLHIDKSAGFQYRRQLTVGHRKFIWAVQGPVVAGEAYGLGFKVRF